MEESIGTRVDCTAANAALACTWGVQLLLLATLLLPPLLLPRLGRTCKQAAGALSYQPLQHLRLAAPIVPACRACLPRKKERRLTGLHPNRLCPTLAYLAVPGCHAEGAAADGAAPGH